MTQAERRTLKLNVGCGRDVKDGWTNLDTVRLPGVDVVFDLDRISPTHKIPIPPDSVSEFWLGRVLERVRYPLVVMQDLWRVATSGARMTVVCPHAASDGAWADPTYRRPFFPESFSFFAQPTWWRTDAGYRGDWQVLEVALSVDAWRWPHLNDDMVLIEIGKYRNTVTEMAAKLVAIKPARPTEPSMQTQPKLIVRRV